MKMNETHEKSADRRDELGCPPNRNGVAKINHLVTPIPCPIGVARVGAGRVGANPPATRRLAHLALVALVVMLGTANSRAASASDPVLEFRHGSRQSLSWPCLKR
jgi:hypothetical protein